MTSLFPLQEFTFLTYVQGKLRASTSYFIFYVDSLHAAWILYWVLSKLLYSSICVELMVALMPTVPWVSPPLSLISISTLSMCSYNVTIDCSPT
ncbi:hypothetical protein B296_00029924 [Ensete ventricosum]|uniref:Uncharacterized protein n=1 Tax=Ensete ventricosum TaxID=4639 RepID=A0A427AAS2_ENSVE|nr:hypothetical protein B296_00029924 [Ensete ventricosum]